MLIVTCMATFPAKGSTAPLEYLHSNELLVSCRVIIRECTCNFGLTMIIEMFGMSFLVNTIVEFAILRLYLSVYFLSCTMMCTHNLDLESTGG